MKTRKSGLWRKTIQLLILGLELPLLVLAGLYLSWNLTTGWADPWRSLVILALTLGCYALGTLIIWWVALKIYRGQKRPT